MKRPLKLRIEISCEVLPDGKLGGFSVTASAPHRSGYALSDPFDMPALKNAETIIRSSFKKISR